MLAEIFPSTMPSFYQTYDYDSFGNILHNGSFESQYNPKNQMLGYDYDDSGNLRSDGMNLMTWDAESRMATASGTTYIYDAEGNRVEKQGATVIDTVYFSGQPIARYSGGQWTDLIYGPMGLLAEVPGNQTAPPVFRVTDNLGTNVGSILANGAFVNPVDHTPFGQVTGNTSDPYLFTGKERDTESGLDYFGARYYASNMGRFMSPDWASHPQAVLYASLGNPQSLNLYSYVSNNPLSRADADGHFWTELWNALRTGCGCWTRDYGSAKFIANSWDLYEQQRMAPAIQHFTSTSRMMGYSMLIGGPLGGEEGATQGALGGELGDKVIVERVMSEAELKATQDTSLLRGGRDGTYFVTDSVGTNSASEAQDRLALPNTPEVKVRMEVDRSALSEASTVQPANGMNGGGTERTATGNVPVRILDVTKLN